jgi:hypothetical protein
MTALTLRGEVDVAVHYVGCQPAAVEGSQQVVENRYVKHLVKHRHHQPQQLQGPVAAMAASSVTGMGSAAAVGEGM